LGCLPSESDGGERMEPPSSWMCAPCGPAMRPPVGAGLSKTALHASQRSSVAPVQPHLGQLGITDRPLPTLDRHPSAADPECQACDIPCRPPVFGSPAAGAGRNPARKCRGRALPLRKTSGDSRAGRPIGTPHRLVESAGCLVPRHFRAGLLSAVSGRIDKTGGGRCGIRRGGRVPAVRSVCDTAPPPGKCRSRVVARAGAATRPTGDCRPQPRRRPAAGRGIRLAGHGRRAAQGRAAEAGP